MIPTANLVRPEVPKIRPGATASERRPELRPLWRAGFRPFFLLAGVYAALALAAWVASYLGLLMQALPAVGMYGHGHEMVFGVVGAAVAGFLLTAVPQWTATEPLSGWRLKLLVAAWLSGRVVMWSNLDARAVLLVDSLFLVLLLAFVTGAIASAKNRRNAPFPVLLVVLLVANVTWHLGALGVYPAGTVRGLRLGIGVIVMMMTLIGGRIVPAFTRARAARASENVTLRHSVVIERGAIAASLLSVLGWVIGISGAVQTVFSLSAGSLLLLRQLGWDPWSARRDPLLWVLHFGCLWLAIGHLLLGASAWTSSVNPGAGLHAWTAGAMGTLIVGVMSRATLGHTGRMLHASRTLTYAYIAVNLAALMRVASSLFLAGHARYSLAIGVGGALWILAFALFTLNVLPMVLAPRVDGRPG